MIELDPAPALAGADGDYARGYRCGYAHGFNRGVELAHELPRPETVAARALPHRASGAASTLLLIEEAR